MADLGLLTELKALRELHLPAEAARVDLSPLASCENLAAQVAIADGRPVDGNGQQLRSMDLLVAVVALTGNERTGEVQSVDLGSWPAVKDLSTFEHLSGLRSLRGTFPDLEKVGTLKGLEDFEARDVEVFGPLTGVPALTRATIYGKGGKTLDLHGLANHVRLEELTVEGAIKDVEPLTSLAALRRFVLPNLAPRGGYSNIAWLAALPGLKSLELGLRYHEGDLLDVSPLEGLIGLRQLSLANIWPSMIGHRMGYILAHPFGSRTNQDPPLVQTLAPLENLEELEELTCALTPDVESLKPLSKMKNLKRLCLSGGSVRSLAPLSELSKLEDVMLDHFRSLETLEGLNSTSMRQLYIRDAPALNDVSAMSSMNHLTALKFWGCTSLPKAWELRETGEAEEIASLVRRIGKRYKTVG